VSKNPTPGDGGGTSRSSDRPSFSKRKNRSSRSNRRPDTKPEQKKQAEPNKAGNVNVIFNEPQRRILKAIQDKDFFRRPPPLKGDSSARNSSLFCEYHNDNGHLTKDCFTLRRHLEELAKEGHLQKFVGEKKHDGQTGQQRAKAAETDKETSGDTINTIHGIVNRDQLTKKALRAQRSKVMMTERSASAQPDKDPVSIRRLAKGELPSVSFSDEDLIGVASPNEDALVIKARIDVYNVKRVLVDPGSAADVIYRNLFNKLKGVKLKEMNHPIYDFMHQPRWPLGVATLNVKLGPKCVPVDFVVVDADSSYNAILGRVWIAAMKVVPSTIHQVLKFVCPEGVVSVRGSQSTSKECFRNAVAPTLNEKRPDPVASIDTQLAQATKHNKAVRPSEKEKSESPKRKSAMSDPSSSQRNKQKLED
jgi:hypothetical protein